MVAVGSRAHPPRDVRGAATARTRRRAPAPAERAEPAGRARDAAAAAPRAAERAAAGAPRASPRRAARPARADAPRPEGSKPIASPAVRQRAREAGIDLRQVPGSGPAGRITHEDLDAFLARGAGRRRGRRACSRAATGRGRSRSSACAAGSPSSMARRERAHPALHLRRGGRRHRARGAARDAQRAAARRTGRRLTLLPFLMRAHGARPSPTTRSSTRSSTTRRASSIAHGGVHVGIATQTPTGLMVPVVRARRGARPLGAAPREVARLAEAARDRQGDARRADRLDDHDHLARRARRHRRRRRSSTIPRSRSSASTRSSVRPVWDGTAVRAAQDDEPVVELRSPRGRRLGRGATFVQRIKALLESAGD